MKRDDVVGVRRPIGRGANLCCGVLAALTLFGGAAGATAGRNEALGHGSFYRRPNSFTIEYGLSTADREVDSVELPGLDGKRVTVAGKFYIHEYRRRDLRIRAIFWPPGGVLAAAVFSRDGRWTPAQRDQLLADHGPRWRAFSEGRMVSSESVWAIYLDRSFYLLSPRLLGAIDEQSLPQERPKS